MSPKRKGGQEEAHPTSISPRGLVELTDSAAPDFLEHNALALLLFAAADPASQRMRARVALVQAKLGVAAGALDVDAHRLVAEALGVRGVPAVLVFARGEVVDRAMGAPPESVIEEMVLARLAPEK